MPITQTYKINTGNAYEGMLYGLKTAMEIRTVTATDDMESFGLPVVATANTVRGVNFLAIAADLEACYGITLRQINHESDTRPSTGSLGVYPNEDLGMMVEGEIMVRLGKAAKRDEPMAYDVNGWTGKTNSTDTKAYCNVTALQAGAAGDIIPVRIFSATRVA